jgi:hypothetical protein
VHLKPAIYITWASPVSNHLARLPAAHTSCIACSTKALMRRRSLIAPLVSSKPSAGRLDYQTCFEML